MVYHTVKIFDGDKFRAVLKGVELAQCMQSPDDCVSKDLDVKDAMKIVEDLTISDAKTCSFCNTTFDDQSQQRQHYKLDWHRYNLKQHLAGLPAITENDFDQYDDGMSSISGSDSDTSDDEDATDRDTSQSLKLAETTPTDSRLANYLSIKRHCKAFFENAHKQIFSVYRCLLYNKKAVPENHADLVGHLKHLKSACYWTIIMIGGGHFAIGIFKNGTILHHKTFHSYTVRAKQGGAQSSKDNRMGNNAKSAGASLRRYNEQTLTKHIHDILTSMSVDVQNCDLIFYRAVGPQNRATLFGNKSSPLNKLDARLRTIPFHTRRATFKEVQRVYELLSSVEVYGSAYEFTKAVPVTPPATVPVVVDNGKRVDADTTPKVKKPRKPRGSGKSGCIDRAKSRELVERELPGAEIRAALIHSTTDSSTPGSSRRASFDYCDNVISFSELKEFDDDVPRRVKQQRKRPSVKKTQSQQKVAQTDNSPEAQLVSEIKKDILRACREKVTDAECLDATLCTALGKLEDNKCSERWKKVLNDGFDKNGNTLLHLCARNGNSSLISTLLRHGCDPSVKNSQNQTPYSSTDNKDVRVTFRVFQRDNPDMYEYSKAHIPGPYDEALEREKEEKRKALRKVKRDKEKEKKKERLAQKIEDEEKIRFAQLSDRDKRALAAERRIVAQNTTVILNRCYLCGANITGRVPFTYEDFQFCSIVCLQAHRVKNSTLPKKV